MVFSAKTIEKKKDSVAWISLVIWAWEWKSQLCFFGWFSRWWRWN